MIARNRRRLLISAAAITILMNWAWLYKRQKYGVPIASVGEVAHLSTEQQKCVSRLLANGASVRLADNGSVKSLGLNRREFHDEHLGCLRSFPSVQFLNLEWASITDAGLDHLRDMQSLEVVRLPNSGISAQAMLSLHDALPTAKIRDRRRSATVERIRRP